jgi:hypothetical protein
MGVPAAEALSALRLTAGQAVTLADVPVVAAAIAEHARRARDGR